MLSRLNDTYKWSIAPIKLRYDEMLLPLYLVVDYTIRYSYIEN
jgi:hypothetical protein